MTKPATRRVPFPADIHALTGLRLFLALGVVAFHYQLAWTPPIEAAGLMNRSRLSVDIFFMLSGFILSHVYLQGGTLDYGRFLVARVARIYPLHLFILGGMLAMVAAAGVVGVGLEPGRFNAPDFFSTLFLTHAWFPSSSMNLWNGPSWSLSAEWFAYLTFPVFAWVGLRLKTRPLILLALSAALFVVIDWGHVQFMGAILPRSEGNMGILRIIPEFLGGIGLYFLGEALNPGRRTAVVLATLCTAVLLLAMQIPLDDRLIVLAGAPFLLSIALLSKSGQGSFLSHPVARFGGQISFALYLCHVPVLMVWRNAAEAVFHLPNEYRMGGLEVAGLLATSLVVAAVLHVCVERPANAAIRKRAYGLRSLRRDPAGHPI